MQDNLYCSVARRFSAYLIDVIVQVVFIGTLALLLELQPFLGLLGSGLLLLASTWLYFALMESSKFQATLGKLLLGIKVVDLNGERISFWRASVRFFGKFCSRLLLGLGFVMMLFSKKKQCLHDKFASTVIVKN